MKYLLILSLFLFGCSGTKTYLENKEVIRVDTILVPLPVYRDSIQTVIKQDTVFAEDKKIIFKYLPAKNTVYYETKKDTIKIIKTDTTTIYKTEIKEGSSFIDTLETLFVSMIIAGIFTIPIILYIIRRKK